MRTDTGDVHKRHRFGKVAFPLIVFLFHLQICITVMAAFSFEEVQEEARTLNGCVEFRSAIDFLFSLASAFHSLCPAL